MGIENIFGSMQERPKERELKTEADCELEEEVARICAVYEKLELSTWINSQNYSSFGFAMRDLKVTRQGIKEFCKRLKVYEDKSNFDRTGVFLGALVQRAYLGGHNDFVLNLEHLDTVLSYVCAFIMGNHDNRVKVTIDGATKECCAYGTYNSIFIFNGLTGTNCGVDAYHCDFYFYAEKIGCACGYRSTLCKFHSPHRSVLCRISDETNGHFYLIEPKTGEEGLYFYKNGRLISGP